MPTGTELRKKAFRKVSKANNKKFFLKEGKEEGRTWNTTL